MSAILDHCPCCGGPLTDRDLTWSREARTLIGGDKAVMLGDKQAQMFDLVWRAKGLPIDIAVIIDAVYAADPNGGPDAAQQAIIAQAARIREKIAPLGITLSRREGPGYRIYRLPRVEAA